MARLAELPISLSLRNILVTGTCLEYGMRDGALSEDIDTRPDCSYALAKDTLRKFLLELKKTHPFRLQWCRLFYMYGHGQSAKSLFAQLDAAIERGDTSFNMSGGEQLRDFSPVEQVAAKLASVLTKPNADGVYNVCSGQAQSVRRLVEHRLQSLGACLDLNLGYYPYPDYEPFAFWGDSSRLNQLLKSPD
jgi:nucleoside-diphosphate-sugar epimerase